MFTFTANKNAFQIDITAYVTPYEWSSPYVIDENRPLLTSYVDLLPKQQETAWVRCVFQNIRGAQSFGGTIIIDEKVWKVVCMPQYKMMFLKIY